MVVRFSRLYHHIRFDHDCELLTSSKRILIYDYNKIYIYIYISDRYNYLYLMIDMML